MKLSRPNAGVFPPVPTILDAEGKFDRAGMKLLIDRLIEQGVHGMLFLGTAGEFTLFTAEQREEIAEACLEYTNGRIPAWIGTGSTTVAETLPLTGQDLAPAFVARLAAHYPNVLGIKDTVDQLSHIRQMIMQVKAVSPDFSVFCGFDEYLLPTLAAGGDGAIAASANFAPELMLGVYDSFKQGDLAGVLAFQKRLIEIPALYAIDDPFVASIKEAVRLSGLPVSTFSLASPGVWSAEHEDRLKQIFSRAGIAH